MRTILLPALVLAASLGLLPLTSSAQEETAPAPLRDEPDYAVDVGGTLYAIDCETLTYRKLGRVRVPGERGQPEDAPVLCDLAATADGYLYGISTTALYLINLTKPEASQRIGAHGLSAPYGMGAVGSSLVVNTLAGEVHLVDRRSADTVRLGAMGGPWVASGDVALAGEHVVSSVKDGARGEHLVTLDPQTGKATLVDRFKDARGRAVDNVFGLIERKGVLYALTSDGDILRVDPATARCTLLRRTGIPWWGATSYTRI